MIALGPKKDGGPNIEFFQSPESMQGFETIRLWLQKNCKKVSLRSLMMRPLKQRHTAQCHVEFFFIKIRREQNNILVLVS